MSQTAIARAAILVSGLFYALTGFALTFAPEWFFTTIAHYPPFNRHFTGDLGAFTLALGVALLWAARNPAQHRGLIGYAVLASLLHALNHTYDDLLLAKQSLTNALVNAVSLYTFAIMLAAVYVTFRRRQA